MVGRLPRTLEGEGPDFHLRPAVRSWQLGKMEREVSRRG